MPPSRRQFLGSLTAAAALLALPPRLARALGPAQLVSVLRLQYDGPWDINPGALACLLEETKLRTSIATASAALPTAIDAPQLGDSLLAVLAGDAPFTLRDPERQRLARWLGLGGLLLCDNAGQTAPSAGFERSVRAEFQRILPDARWERISPDHVLYRTFYRLDYPAGRAIFQSYIEGLRVGGRFAVLYFPNDLLGALARTPDKRFSHVPTPGGESQRELAIRFAVNLVMYATCLNYKDDQVHLDHLLRTRKWKIRPDR